MKGLLALVLLTLLLSACGEEAIRDVQYYIDHPQQRADKLTECQNNPSKKKSPNCINASAAEYKSMFKGEEMPSIK